MEAVTVDAFRAYLNKREGNEHSRVIDMAVGSFDEAGRKAESLVGDDEVIDQITSITVSEEHELV